MSHELCGRSRLWHIFMSNAEFDETLYCPRQTLQEIEKHHLREDLEISQFFKTFRSSIYWRLYLRNLDLTFLDALLNFHYRSIWIVDQITQVKREGIFNTMIVLIKVNVVPQVETLRRRWPRQLYKSRAHVEFQFESRVFLSEEAAGTSTKAIASFDTTLSLVESYGWPNLPFDWGGQLGRHSSRSGPRAFSSAFCPQLRLTSISSFSFRMHPTQRPIVKYRTVYLQRRMQAL